MREEWRISESNQGLSSGRTVTSLLGIHVLTKLRKVSVNFSKASLIDPSYKRSQLWFTTSCLSGSKFAFLQSQISLPYVFVNGTKKEIL